MDLQRLKELGKASDWLTEEGLKTLQGGYLQSGETPVDMYRRVSKAAASYYPASMQQELESKFFAIIYKGWLGLATPVASNMGTSRGLPVSCFSSFMPDTLNGIFDTIKEVAVMTKYGGGTAVHMNKIRSTEDSVLGTGGTASGPVSWAKILDSTISSVSQGAIRRGAVAAYLPIEHTDANSFIMIRHPSQDQNKYCPNIHHGVTISDSFMQDMLAGDKDKRDKWKHLMTTRLETGEPFVFFSDAAQQGNPKHLPWYRVNGSNLCSEIFLHTDDDHSFVCCLSSMNLAKYDEWKDTDAVKTAIYFLDAVMQEFIAKAYFIPGMERAYNFAVKSRALGLGVLGWHTLLQSKMFAFDSFESMMLNSRVFSSMKQQADEASREIAEILGEPEWMQGTGKRNSHLLAVAPTVSNALISGGVSQGIEPISANVFVQKSAKGTFIRYNPTLKQKLGELGLDNSQIWDSIIKADGSVLGIKEIPEEVQQVFLTARELNQFAIVKQAGQRQKFIDQGQSVNLFFSANSEPKYIHQVHVEAWKEGLKSLYYLRSSAAIRSDLASRSVEECKACEG